MTDPSMDHTSRPLRCRGPKGEIVLVIGPATAVEIDLEGPLAALRTLVEAGAKPRPAAGVVAELTGASANALYRALTAKDCA